MNGVAERIEDGLHGSRQTGIVMPHICHRQRDELGKLAGAVNAYPLGGRAGMATACHAIAAAPAHHMPFPADHVTNLEVGHVGTNGHDFAHEFMTNHQGNRDRSLSPRVPLVNV